MDLIKKIKKNFFEIDFFTSLQFQENSTQKKVNKASNSIFNSIFKDNSEETFLYKVFFETPHSRKFVIKTIFQSDFINDGSYIEVFKINTLDGPLAFKISRTEMGYYHLENETTILKKIHENGIILGIQPPHYEQELQIELDIDQHPFFCLTKFYPTSLLEIGLKLNEGTLTLSNQQKIQGTLQLLKGLKNLHEKGFIHGDIKPDNYLVDVNYSFFYWQTNSYNYHLSDFGGACQLIDDEGINKIEKFLKNNENKHSFFEEVTFSKEYLSEDDKVAFNNLVNQWKKNPNKRLIQDLNSLLMARDVYALGCTLELTLLKSFLTSKDVTIKNWLQTMTNQDYKKRPTANEALNELEQLSCNFHQKRFHFF